MDADYYCHSSTGTVLYDPGQGTRHFEPWFALLSCDDGIVDYLTWHLRRAGIELDKGSRWGAHVTFVRGEPPASPDAWGTAADEEIAFHYANVIRWSNGRHAWVDVCCPRLNELRAALGLAAKPDARYHLALGRLREPHEDLENA
jgi:hypothetical protein